MKDKWDKVGKSICYSSFLDDLKIGKTLPCTLWIVSTFTSLRSFTFRKLFRIAWT